MSEQSRTNGQDVEKTISEQENLPSISRIDAILSSFSQINANRRQPRVSAKHTLVAKSGDSHADQTPPNEFETPDERNQHHVRCYGDRYGVDEYQIELLAKYDDNDLVNSWLRALIFIHPALILWAVVSYMVYFGYRVWCNYDYRAMNGGTANASWIFVCLEGVCIFPFLSYMMILLFSLGNRERPQLRLRGSAVPTVDVLLTTCGEAIQVIVNSTLGACNIDYPPDRYRVIICDDAADPVLRESLQPLLTQYPQLHYQARIKEPGVPHHYKAGNLQSGIDFAATLPGGAAEYIATLDADMIPHPEWLRALLPHLLRDPLLGLISPPQTFWNLPADDPLGQSLNDFIHYLEVRKDHMGAAWCTGSGVVLKRFMIDEIGGWPTPSMAEDQLLSFVMNGKGYRTAYLHEFMQVGMVPESIISHLKQRTRWAVGTLETAQVLSWGFVNQYTRHMTLTQRLCIFTFALNTIMMIPQFMAFFVIPALLYWGRPLLVYTTLFQLRWQIRLASIWVCSMRVNEIVFSLPSGYIQGQRSSMAWQFMMPYLAMAVLRCYLLPKWLGGSEIAFQASGAVRDRLMERSSSRRAGLLTRIKLIGSHCHIWLFACYVAYSLGAGGIDFWRAWRVGHRSGHISDSLLHLLQHSLLPPTWWLFLAISYAVPIVYMFFPPTVPEFDEALVVDPVTGVSRPVSMEVRQKWSVLSLVREVLWAITVVYCIVLFVGTFIY